MKFLKPKFWDEDAISFFSILILPIALSLQLLNYFKNLFIKKYKFSIPVICVGNIYLGGTGKTPLCIELFYILKNLNKKPVFVKKKYKSHFDEVKLLKNIGPVYEYDKRLNALNAAIKNNANIAILDDGFQDFSIKNKISIVCFNETQWIGNGFTIPAGPLREKLSSLKRADFVIINGNKNLNIEKKILKNNKLLKIFYTKYMPHNIDWLKNKKVICFAGIGNPNNFFNILKKNNIEIIEQIPFPDHYNYSNKDLELLINKSSMNNVVLLTTEKDYFRINESYRKNINYLKIKVEIEDKKQLIDEIKKFI
jgi:tetraacyldisaccharide 4'-kinase